MNFLQVESITLEEGTNVALNNISFTLPSRRKMAIAGETGSGKSSLLQIIAGLIQPTTGRVYFQDKKVIGPQDQLIPGHPGIAYLSQQFELPRSLRVEQVLRYANKLLPAEAEQLYKVCRIDHLLSRRTDQLSGGERQRIAMARLLLAKPRLFLLDEPYSNLDAGHKNILKSIIHDMSDKLDITVMLVSHDPQDTLSWADEIIVLQAGTLLQSGTPQHLYNQPVNVYVASLFGNYNLISSSQALLIPGLSGLAFHQKDMLIRPEKISLHAETNSTLKGIIQKIGFYGSFFEIQVLLTSTCITIKTTKNHFQVGETVGLAVAPEDIWYL